MLALKSILILSALVSTLYWLVLFIKISLYKESSRYTNFTTPSILISAKNEAENLEKYLLSVIQQSDYFRILVMDDYSSDLTKEVLDSYAISNDKMSYATPSQDLPGKKLALSEGIEQCTTNIILLTDADCYPATENWATLMASKISERTQVVLGYGPLEKTAGLLNHFARYETVTTAIQYFGYSLYNQSYMGVGRNMAFTKRIFLATNGYARHKHISSGDDDLFVQDASKLTNVAVTLDPDSFVYSKAPEKLKAYIQQKKRHVATSTNYTILHKLLLSIPPFFHLLTFSTSIVLILAGSLKLVLGIWLTRWITLMVTAYRPYKRLDGADLIKWIPLMDVLLIGYYIYFGCSALNRKNASW